MGTLVFLHGTSAYEKLGDPFHQGPHSKFIGDGQRLVQCCRAKRSQVGGYFFLFAEA
jgi:hypothetical protein